jgi:HAE1 family hydrophobic/amphiphilic exporter-1
MLAFWVNRPIVAMGLSIVTVLVGLVAMQGPPIAQHPKSCADGAGHDDVRRRERHGRRASVATPLEQQINGVEQMIYMKSTNANDGTLTLKVSFEVGSNLDMDNVLTQNRACPRRSRRCRSAVKQYGVSVKKALAFPLLVISIKSPNGTYATTTSVELHDDQRQRRHRVFRAWADQPFGGSDYAMRVWLRPDRIGRLGLTVPDIANAIAAQNQLSPASQIGGAPATAGGVHLHRQTQGRLLNEEQFGNIILRTNRRVQIKLKTSRASSSARCSTTRSAGDGKPAAVTAVFQILEDERSTSRTASRPRWRTCRRNFRATCPISCPSTRRCRLRGIPEILTPSSKP